MKKLTQRALWLIAVITTIGLAVSACDDGSNNHNHQWGEWEETTAATCMAEGVETRVCAADARHTETRPIGIDAEAHNMQPTANVIEAATCTATGLGQTACANGCGRIRDDDVLPKLEHEMREEDWTVVEAATCEEDGEEERFCHRGCGHREALTLPKLGHHHVATGRVHTAPTCETAGSEEKECDNLDGECGDIIAGDAILPLGHDPVYIDGGNIATCVTPGSGAQSCLRCEADLTSLTEYPVLGHAWLVENWVITEHPTCLVNGSRVRECDREGCPVDQTENNTPNLPAYGSHHYPPTTPATCTTAGVPHNCDRSLHLVGGADYICGHINPEVVPALGHDHGTSGTGSLICKRENCNHQYAIGSTGPAGGIIFYVAPSGITIQGYGNSGDNGYFAVYTAYYLEAAPANETMSVWGPNVLIAGITTWANEAAKDAGLAASIGIGRKDTQTMVNSTAFAAWTDTAAQRCASKSLNGFTDWFLPSLGELNEFYKLKGQAGVPQTGIPTAGSLWSSSQTSAGGVWGQNFGTGNHNFNSSKGSNGAVRAIRAF